MIAIQYIRSLIFWFGFIASTILVTATLTIAWPLPFRWRFYISRTWSILSISWLRLTCGLHYSIEGTENIPHEDQPVIYMSKHQSTWETVLFQNLFPPMVWVLKKELMWIPIFGWGLAMLKPIAINRSAGRKAINQLIAQGRQRLDEGLSVIIFPEGTRTAPGAEPHYHVGGALLASKSGYPVIPIAHNAGCYWPKRTLLKYPGTIRVVIGQPINTKGMKTAEIMDTVQEWIESTVDKLGCRDEDQIKDKR